MVMKPKQVKEKVLSVITAFLFYGSIFSYSLKILGVGRVPLLKQNLHNEEVSGVLSHFHKTKHWV